MRTIEERIADLETAVFGSRDKNPPTDAFADLLLGAMSGAGRCFRCGHYRGRFGNAHRHGCPVALILQEPIDEVAQLGLSARAQNAMEATQTYTIKQFMALTRESLRPIRNAGMRTWVEIKHKQESLQEDQEKTQ